MKQVDTHIDWIESLKNFQLSDESAKLLTDGNVYIRGRDNNGYPSCIFLIYEKMFNRI